MKTTVLGISSPLGRKTSFGRSSLTWPLRCLCHCAPIHSFAASLREITLFFFLIIFKPWQRHPFGLCVSFLSISPGTCVFQYFQQLSFHSFTNVSSLLNSVDSSLGRFIVFSLTLQIRG